uniref:ATP synthase complex subunit 8 n=1 Tax=Cryptopygus antarcticus TaxID=187623 RepID=B2BSB5_CRYAT|nr:ATP synthase F0 subunit 8 [Cryptopygus antarcticus]ABS57568.1 ATP synthase F0 subunit 8 [Cryptopygus antarcticus]
MPQMAPLSWLILFFMFSILFLFSMAKMFFSKMNLSFTYTPANKTETKSPLTWKW